MREKNPRRVRLQPEHLRLVCDTLGLACISAAGFVVYLWLGLFLAGVSLLLLSWRQSR